MIFDKFEQTLLLALSSLLLASCTDKGEITNTDPQAITGNIVTESDISPPSPFATTPDANPDTTPASTPDATPATTSDDDPAAPPVVVNTIIDETTASNIEPTDNQNSAQPGVQSRLIDPASWDYEEVHNKSGFELVFSDEFNGYDINPDRWHTQLRWDGDFNGSWYEYRVINGEKQFYVNVLTRDGEHRDKLLQNSSFTPFRFNGSRLAIRATTNPHLESRSPTRMEEEARDITFGRFEPILKRQPFLSGVMASYDNFSQKYGYFEARIRLPAHVGTFPAFWLHHQRDESENTQRSEIDIMENLGHAPGVVYNTFHYFDYVTIDNPGQPNSLKPEPSGRATVGGNFSDNYHVYAVDWRPGSIVWLIDGQPVSWLSSPQVDFEPMYVILNLAIGGDWINFPQNFGGLGRGETDFYPTTDEQDPLVFGNPEMEIDYVRVYRRLP